MINKQILYACLSVGLIIATNDVNGQDKARKKGEDATKKEVAISDKNYLVYSSLTNKKSSLKEIIKAMDDYDVVFYGEEHNDAVTHYLESTLFKKLYSKYGKELALSLEMFDRDVQYIIDEYLNGWIKEYYFNKDSRQWKNYSDYKPLVEFAKENELNVIAANAPFRYVSIASKETQSGLEKLSEQAKQNIAPLPYMSASGEYKEKLMIVMGLKPDPDKPADAVADTLGPKHSYAANMSLDGQSLWDATMAYSISEYLKDNPGKKVMHVNGRFHTDQHFGIVQQLKRYSPNLKVLVISASRDDDFPKVDFKEEKDRCEFIIFTDPEVPPTFDSQ